MSNRFKVGKIANTHGLKGDVKIYPYTEYKERFEEFSYLMIDGQGDEKFEIAYVKYHKNMVIMKLKAFNNINEVERFKDRDVYILREDAGELEEDSYFVVDMIGMTVVDDVHGEIGKLKDVLQHTAQDLYVVKQHGSESDILIPAVKEFIKEIDMVENKITVHLIEGMM